MKRGVALFVLAFSATVALAQADAPRPKVYALVSAMGDRFTTAYEVQQVGSHMAPYRRSTAQAANHVLDRLVLSSLDNAIRKLDPASERLYRAVTIRRPESAFDDAMAEIAKMPERGTWDRIVVITPAHTALGRDGLASRTNGMGLFVQPLCQGDTDIVNGAGSCDMGGKVSKNGPEALTPSGETVRVNRFVAPFSYLEVHVLDAKTLAVLDRHEVYEHEKLFDPDSDSQDFAQAVGKRFLASRMVHLIEKAVEDGVLGTELRGKVDVKDPKEVKQP